MSSTSAVHPYLRYPASRALGVPAEVQEGPRGGGHAPVIPAQEVELGHSACLAGAHVLQVEAPHEEILAPDVLRDQIHLGGRAQKWVLAPGTGCLPSTAPLRREWEGGDSGSHRRAGTAGLMAPSHLPDLIGGLHNRQLCFFNIM